MERKRAGPEIRTIIDPADFLFGRSTERFANRFLSGLSQFQEAIEGMAFSPSMPFQSLPEHAGQHHSLGARRKQSDICPPLHYFLPQWRMVWRSVMGRPLRRSDTQGDLEFMLKHCLGLADAKVLPMTAIRISTAIDQYQIERVLTACSPENSSASGRCRTNLG